MLINGEPVTKSSLKLKVGDDLSRLHPLCEEPDVDTNMKVLWTDGLVAAVLKPAGLPMHESGRYRRKTVAGILPQVLGPEWGYVHRLDRETSGVVVCAKTPELRAKIVESWTQKFVEKTYLAITSTVPALQAWTIDLPIRAERHERTNRAVLCSSGDPAVTQFRVLSESCGRALLEVRPLTGRTNQIRLHLTASQLTLVGEKVYGVDPAILETYRCEGNTSKVQEMAGFPRHALHSWKVLMKHPMTGAILSLEAPLTEDLQGLCKFYGLAENSTRGREL